MVWVLCLFQTLETTLKLCKVWDLKLLSILNFELTLKLCKVWDLELWQVWGCKIIPGSIPIKHTTFLLRESQKLDLFLSSSNVSNPDVCNKAETIDRRCKRRWWGSLGDSSFDQNQSNDLSLNMAFPITVRRVLRKPKAIETFELPVFKELLLKTNIVFEFFSPFRPCEVKVWQCVGGFQTRAFPVVWQPSLRPSGSETSSGQYATQAKLRVMLLNSTLLEFGRHSTRWWRERLYQQAWFFGYCRVESEKSRRHDDLALVALQRWAGLNCQSR